FNLALLRSQKFAAHFRESGTQFGNFAGAFGRDGVGVVPSGKRTNSGDEVVQGLRDGTGDETEQQSSEDDRRSAEYVNRAGEMPHERIERRQWHHDVAAHRRW